MSRPNKEPNDNRVVKRREFLTTTAKAAAMVATLGTGLGVSVTRAFAEGHSKLKLGESLQIKWILSPDGETIELRGYKLQVKDGRVLLISPDGERAIAKDGEYLLQDGLLIIVSDGEAKTARGNPVLD